LHSEGLKILKQLQEASWQRKYLEVNQNKYWETETELPLTSQELLDLTEKLLSVLRFLPERHLLFSSYKQLLVGAESLLLEHYGIATETTL
jgi:hypothetical protein